MDAVRFDAWTRRRFGLATGGLAASLLGLPGLEDAEAKKHKNKKKKNKNKNKQCKRLGQSCDNSKKKKRCCNDKQICGQVEEFGSGNFCCKQAGQGCSRDEDCCGSDFCNNTDKCEIV